VTAREGRSLGVSEWVTISQQDVNTFADVIVVVVAATARANLTRKPHLVQRLRQGSGLFIAGLGISLALARRPAPV